MQTTEADAMRQKIDALATKITTVVTQHAEAERAYADKLEAQAALVGRMLELAQPIVSAIGTRPKISEARGTRQAQLASSRAGGGCSWEGRATLTSFYARTARS